MPANPVGESDEKSVIAKMLEFVGLFSPSTALNAKKAFVKGKGEQERGDKEMKKTVMFVCLVAAALVLPALAGAQAAKGKAVEVRITGHMPVGQLCTVACERFIKDAETRSQGALKFIH